MDRETLAARLFGRPRVALDPQSTAGLDLRQPGTTHEAKCEGFGSRGVVAMAQEAYFQTETLLAILTQLERIANALEHKPAPRTNPNPATICRGMGPPASAPACCQHAGTYDPGGDHPRALQPHCTCPCHD